MSALMQGSAAGLGYLWRDGEGMAPLVLLHGIGSNAQSFAPLLAAFDHRIAALAWDAPGYGDSAPLAPDWPDASDYAAALRRLLDHRAIARCCLIGHSLGALMAARFATLWPQRVTILCLISPALGYAAKPNGPLPPNVASRIEQLDRLGAEKFAAARAPLLLADPPANPALLQAVERAMAGVRRPGYDQAARMLACGRLLDDAARLTVPTVVLVGEQDRVTPPANARRVFAALPLPSRGHYREIAGAGHAVCQERPEEVARTLHPIVAAKANAHA